MHHDIRLPTVVVVGHWNPHIFSFDWVAKTLFGTADGQAVEIAQMFDGSRNVVATYMFGVGYACTPERLEVYVTDLSAEAMTRAEGFLRKALETLSHTPVAGIGFNYIFRDTEVDAELADAFVTPEDLRSNFKVVGEDHRTRIELDQGLVLNLARKVSPQGSEVSFNYHHEAESVDKVLGCLDGSISKFKGEAYQMMVDLYHQDEIDVVAHQMNEPGEGANGA